MIQNEEVTIVKVVEETHDTKTFYVEMGELPNEFLPGQFHMVSADCNEETVKRAYSIATSPTEKLLGFTIKVTPGGKFSTYSFNNFKEGHSLCIAGPYGKFVYKDEQKPVTLIGAGSGIAPLRSMAKYILDKEFDIPIKLLFSNKEEKDIIYKKEFEEWSQKFENFKYYFTITRPQESINWQGPTGRIDKEKLEEEIASKDGMFFICGAPEFVKTMEKMLEELGVKEEQIRTEKY